MDITINGGTEYQTIDGFGTSVMMWMGNVFGNAQVREAYATDLGCSVVRGDMRPSPITGDVCQDRNPTTFGSDIAANIARMNFTYSDVRITGEFMKWVYDRRIDSMTVTFSIWTPPHWMKAGTAFIGQGCGSYKGHLIRTAENRTNFARYVAAWLKGFSDYYRVPVHTLSLQNELDWAHDEATWTLSCQYFASKYPGGDERTANGPPVGENDLNPAIRVVYNELRANNLPIKLMGPEKSHIFGDIWGLSFQMAYIKDMAAAGDVMNMIDIFCHHGYGFTPGSQARNLMNAYWNGNTNSNPDLTWTGIRTYNKRSWQTEAAIQPITWDGALQLARCIQDELVAGNLSAYFNWNFASDGSDGYALLINMTQKTDKYYAFKHFSRYIRPGARRLACTPDDPNGLSVSAFRHPGNNTLTIVMVNAGAAQTARVTLPAQPAGITSFAVYTSSSGAVWRESSAAVSGSTVQVSVPASGIVTLFGQGAIGVKQPRQAPAVAPERRLSEPVTASAARYTMAGRRMRVGEDGGTGIRLASLSTGAVRPVAMVR